MKVSEKIRKNLFFFLCVPVRVGIAVFVGVALPVLPYYASIAVGCVMAANELNWLRILYKGKNEGGFGGKAWWQLARPLHVCLHISATILIFLKEYVISAGILGTDVALGIGGAFQIYGKPLPCSFAR